MLVLNTKNQQSDISEQFHDYAFSQDKNGNLPLTIGKKYVVSGLKEQNGTSFFLIIPDNGELKSRPWWFPADLFEVKTDEQPDDWVTAGDGNDFSITSFPELVNDPKGEFYNALEDGDENALQVFLEYYKAYAQHHNLWYVDGKPAQE